MKDYQELIGKIIIAIAIIISGFLIANALNSGASNIHHGITHMGEIIRDGLIQRPTP
jgi:hypothetical protein